MRCTQNQGLSPDAIDFLAVHAQRTAINQCETCGHITGGEYISTVYDDSGSLGMFDDGPDLYEYTLKDGSKVREVCQACPWSSGPVIFLCLEKEDGGRFCLWDDDAIEHA